MKSMVYLVQADCVWENKQANFDRVTALLDAEVDALRPYLSFFGTRIPDDRHGYRGA